MPADTAGVFAALSRLERLAKLLDARFVIPGTKVRFGMDPVLGLVPVIGDTVAAVLSFYIVAEAIRLGARPWTVARMVFNVVVDWVFGSVPVAGNVFDVFWRANLRNAELLRRDLSDRQLRSGLRGRRR